MIKAISVFSKAIVLLCLAACGSGSGSGGGGSGANVAPTLTNPGDLTVAEGETAVTTISASDRNGDALAFSLSGDDAAAFSISNGGVLTFLSAPSYSDPNDRDTNNVYILSVSVTDGSATTSVAITVTVVEKVSDFDQGSFRTAAFTQICVATPVPARTRSTVLLFQTALVALRTKTTGCGPTLTIWLWYDEIDDVDPENYADDAEGVADYFRLMKTFAHLPGQQKIAFIFSYDSLVWKQLSKPAFPLAMAPNGW